MLVIANNITTRDRQVRDALQDAATADGKARAASLLQDIACRCLAAGAEMLEINLQQHPATPQMMELAEQALGQLTGCRLCISSDRLDVLQAGLRTCPPGTLVNYVSIDEAGLTQLLPAVASRGAQVVLLLTEPGIPKDAEEMLKRTGVLLGAANEAGITSDRVFLDPGVFHITAAAGQRHFGEVISFLHGLQDSFEPPLRTCCWIGNASVGAPDALRPTIDSAALAMLCGAGLSAAFIDVLRPGNMRMARLAAMLRNERIYAESELAT